MGILIWGSPYGNSHWENLIFLDPYGNSHMGIPMGIPTEILWEWDGNGNGNSTPTATLIIRVALNKWSRGSKNVD